MSDTAEIIRTVAIDVAGGQIVLTVEDHGGALQVWSAYGKGRPTLDMSVPTGCHAAYPEARERLRARALEDVNRKIDETRRLYNDRCATCHRDAHRPGSVDLDHGHAWR